MTVPGVAVVGASASGLYLASLVAANGDPVTVHERSPKLRAQRRTLIVTPRVRDMLGELIEPALISEVRRYELHADGLSAEIELNEPDLVIERSAVIRTLATRAQASGARLRLGEAFKDLSVEDGHLRPRFETNRRAVFSPIARAVVGADGAHSQVARRAGWPAQPTVPLVQAVVRIQGLPPDTARVWFRPSETPYFFWLIPEGPDRAVVGLIGETAQTARRALDAYLSEKELVALEYQAARIPAYGGWTHPHRRLGPGDVFLVGDAAGHVKVSTVGGIHTGFRGAAAIADHLAGGGRRELRALRRELDRHRLVRRALHRFTENDYRRLLRLVGPHTQDVLGTISRDESGRLLRRLILREPRLVLLGLRGLLTSAAATQSSNGTRSKSSARKAPRATIQPISR